MFPLANKNLHGFVDMLYCHFMDMKQVLYIQLQKYYYYLLLYLFAHIRPS